MRVGYIGITCEAPIFTAIEKGFFKEEGLEVELVKCEWAKYKDVLALGGYDITHHLVMYFLKPIEQGLDVKFTAGIHSGCLRVQAPVKGNIHTVADLRGKRIGVPGMGTPPFIFANRVHRRATASTRDARSSGASFPPANSGWRWRRASRRRARTPSRSARCCWPRATCATSPTRRRTCLTTTNTAAR